MKTQVIAPFPFADAESEKNYQKALSEKHRLIVINANRPGTGRSTLARTLLEAHFGSEIACSYWAGRDLENYLEKLIPSALMSKRGYLFFDDVSGRLNSPTLCALATSKYWAWRKMGTHDIASAAVDLTVVITGIAFEISEEIRRRALVINLFQGN